MAELIVTLKGRELKRTPITSTHTFIGRDPACDVFIDNAGVSRTHAVVTFRDGSFQIYDDGSANGLFVNGGQVPAGELRSLFDGDQIEVGKFAIRFQEHAGPPVAQLKDNSDRSDIDWSTRNLIAEATLALSAEDSQKIRSSALEAALAPSPPAGAPRGRAPAAVKSKPAVAASSGPPPGPRPVRTAASYAAPQRSLPAFAGPPLKPAQPPPSARPAAAAAPSRPPRPVVVPVRPVVSPQAPAAKAPARPPATPGILAGPRAPWAILGAGIVLVLLVLATGAYLLLN